MLRAEVNEVRTISVNWPSVASNEMSCLILNKNAPDGSDSQQWSERLVFVGNVQVVKNFDKAVPTDFVRLYAGDNSVKQLRASNVFFLPLSASSTFFCVFPVGNLVWESSPAGAASGPL